MRACANHKLLVPEVDDWGDQEVFMWASRKGARVRAAASFGAFPHAGVHSTWPAPGLLRPSRGTVLALLVAVVLAWVQVPSVAASNDVGLDLIQVPVRWCVLEGSSTAELSEERRDEAVLKRIRRGSRPWVRTALLSMRSAVTDRFDFEQWDFPVITGPIGGPGNPGDIGNPEIYGNADYRRARSACHNAWQDLRLQKAKFEDADKLAKGPVGLIIDDFMDGDSTDSWVLGFARDAKIAYPKGSGLAADVYCRDPRAVEIVWAGDLAVVDSSDGHPSATTDARLVGHEFGHILVLAHGDGVDNDGNRRMDKWCDRPEYDSKETGTSLMSKSLKDGDITNRQKWQARYLARKHVSAIVDPPLEITSAGVLGDDAADTVDDVVATSLGAQGAAAMDIDWVGYSYAPDSALAQFVVTTFGDVRGDCVSGAGRCREYEYSLFVDFGRDGEEGGWPAGLASAYGEYGDHLGDHEVGGVNLVLSAIVVDDEIVGSLAWLWIRAARRSWKCPSTRPMGSSRWLLSARLARPNFRIGSRRETSSQRM